MKRFSLVLTCLLLGGAVGALVSHSVLQGQAPAEAPVLPRPGAAAVPKDLTSYRDIVKKVLPGVVSIEALAASGKARGPARQEDMQFPGRLRPIDDDSPNRVGFGSGFLVSAKGVVVTNFHVVESADHVVVQLRDGRKFTSKDIKTDPKTDLAIVRITAPGPLPYLEFGDSSEMEIGDRVLAVGAPFGLTGTVTHGIISAKGRSLRVNMYEDFLQTDAAINPGNSGGPLISMEARVIGINSAIKSKTGGFQGVGLAIASNLGKNIMRQLLKDGVVKRGYLGVQIKDVDDEATAKRLGLTEIKGVLVTRAFEDAPGAKGGLRAGDVVLSIDGKPVQDGRDLQIIVAGLTLNKPVKVRIVRDSKPRTLDITIEEQPRTFGSGKLPPLRFPERGKGAIHVAKIGVDIADLTTELAEALGYGGKRGAVVTAVERGSLAAAAGFRPGVLITAVNRKASPNAKAARAMIQSGSVETGIRVRVVTPDGRTSEVLLRNAAEE